MMDGSFGVSAYGTVGGFTAFNMMEVEIEGDVASAEIHVKADESFWEVSDEFNEGTR
jgi:hypothetical protein